MLRFTLNNKTCFYNHFYFLRAIKAEVSIRRKRKLDHVLKPLENSMDLEEKYQQKLFSYEELKEKEEREIADVST